MKINVSSMNDTIYGRTTRLLFCDNASVHCSQDSTHHQKINSCMLLTAFIIFPLTFLVNYSKRGTSRRKQVPAVWYFFIRGGGAVVENFIRAGAWFGSFY